MVNVRNNLHLSCDASICDTRSVVQSMSVCPVDLENGISKMPPNNITLLVMMENNFDLSILKIGVL